MATQPPPAPVSAPQGRYSSWAIAAFCCAIGGLLIAVAGGVVAAAGSFVSMAGYICAVVFAYNARREIERDPTVRGAGLASAAMIIGTIMLILFAIGLGLYIAIEVFDA